MSETPNTDAILVAIPITNNVLHAASIRSVVLRHPMARGHDDDLPPGVVVTHGTTERMLVEVLDFENIGEAEAVRAALFTAWREGLREYASLLALGEKS